MKRFRQSVLTCSQVPSFNKTELSFHAFEHLFEETWKSLLSAKWVVGETVFPLKTVRVKNFIKNSTCCVAALHSGLFRPGVLQWHITLLELYWGTGMLVRYLGVMLK